MQAQDSRSYFFPHTQKERKLEELKPANKCSCHSQNCENALQKLKVWKIQAESGLRRRTCQQLEKMAQTPGKLERLLIKRETQAE